MGTQMIVRINPELKTRVARLARAEGKSASEVVRSLLEEYVRDRDIGAYVDDLWRRIGGKLAARGVGAADVKRAIRRVRAKK